MSVALTYAGESLIARLQAEGRPLTIDTFIFADVPGIDHTAPVNPGQGLPEGHEVYRFPIPAEYRAFVNPNQVVYSALLGSDIGPFVFNWQGLYCTEHATLVAVATFPRLEKRKYDPATNTQGNNLTRNFMLEFSGAREVTQVTVEAAVWQLDFSVRLQGMDERERLSNRDIYGRAAFLDDGWLLTRTADAYRFEAGRGYVEGIRAALAEPLPAVPTVSPCDVWLDVSMQGQGSDVVTTVSPLFLAPGTASPDYTTAPPHNTRHYCEKVARIEADGTVVDLRARSPLSATALVTATRDMLAGVIVEWESETIPVLADGMPLGLELDGNVVSLAAFPRLRRKWCGAEKNGTAPAWYRCTSGGVRDAAGGYIKLQDRRGNSPRGWDHGRGVDAGRILASAQEATGLSSGTLYVGGNPGAGIIQSITHLDGPTTTSTSTANSNAATAQVSITSGKVRVANVATMFVVLV